LNDGAHVLPHVPHLRVLRRLHSQEGRIRQLCQTPGNLRLARSSRPFNQQVFRSYFVSDVDRQIPASPSITESTSNSPLGVELANHIPIKILNQFLRSQGCLIILECLEDLLHPDLFLLALETGLGIAVEDEVPLRGGKKEGA
jgi:hypothetical protein